MARPAAPRPVPAMRPAPAPRVAAPPRAAPPRPQAVRPAAPAAPNRAQRIEQPQRPQQRQTVTPNAASPNVAQPGAVQSNQALRRQQIEQQTQERRLRQREDRAERLREQQENRALRALPPSQRATRREQLQQQRGDRAQQLQQQRALRLQQRQNAGQTGQQAIQNRQAIQRTANRRNGAPRVDPQAARRGRFAAAALAGAGVGAAATAANANQIATRRAEWQRARASRMIARHAWRRGWRAAFVPWVGAVYWPYAYSDLFDYTFFPYAYDDDYWAYAYDDMFDGVFWADGGPYATYAAAPPSGGPPRSPAPSAAQARAVDTTAQQACREPGQGVTAWPFSQIERAVKLTDEQKKLLADMQDAAKQAADTFKTACPTDTPLTPPGRLQAVLTRLQATLDAVTIVRPPLDAFYNSLSDEQKARFNLIGPTLGQSTADKTVRQDLMAANQKSCKDAKPGLVNLPIESIEDAIRPTDAQQPLLDQLEQATGKAVEQLAAACPDDIAQTPPGRLAQTEARLKAMVEAAKTVQPALDGLYASLTDEQKSRFNTMSSGTIGDMTGNTADDDN